MASAWTWPGGQAQRVGYEYVHSMVDDHSRFAYSEIHEIAQAQPVPALSFALLRPSPNGDTALIG